MPPGWACHQSKIIISCVANEKLRSGFQELHWVTLPPVTTDRSTDLYKKNLKCSCTHQTLNAAHFSPHAGCSPWPQRQTGWGPRRTPLALGSPPRSCTVAGCWWRSHCCSWCPGCRTASKNNKGLPWKFSSILKHFSHCCHGALMCVCLQQQQHTQPVVTSSDEPDLSLSLYYTKNAKDWAADGGGGGGRGCVSIGF